jgi:predicted CopG family antitoxin
MDKRSTKIIRVSCETYKNLEKLGTLADSFDSVIQRLLTFENKKEVSPHHNEYTN